MGLGISKRLTDLKEDLYRVGQRAEANLGDADVLVIDEVSLLSGDYLELVDKVLRSALGKREPFGGLRVIYCGDFLQLPPIKGHNEPEFQTKWAFQYEPFKEARTIRLTQCMRQERVIDLQLLNELREGRMTQLTKLFIEAATSRDIEGTVELHPRNEAVLEINERKLAEMPGCEQHYFVRYESEEARKAMSKALPVEERVSLKVGAPVIVMVNNPARRYYNGTQGRIVDMAPKQVLIETLDGEQLPVVPHEWRVDLGEERDIWKRIGGQKRRYGTARGMPLKLGWAATIHKSQGLTLERVKTDISRCWEPGHAYVALSRATNLTNVSLIRPFKKVLADPEALRFTQSIP